MIDKRDLKLIEILGENSRSSLTEIAKKLKVSRETVNYRIAKLKKDGIIKGFITLTDLKRAGYTYFAVYLKLKEVNNKLIREIISDIEKEEIVVWVAGLGGKFNLVFEIAIKEMAELRKIYDDLIIKYAPIILKKEICIRVNQYLFYKVRKEDKKSESYVVLDELDHRILALLRKNSRMSYLEIAQNLDAAVSTVIFRVKQMMKNGIINKFTVFLDRKKLGLDTFKLFIYISDYSKLHENSLLSFSMANHMVYYFLKCIGPWNYEIEVDCKGLEELDKIINELRSIFHNSISSIDFVPIFIEEKYIP